MGLKELDQAVSGYYDAAFAGQAQNIVAAMQDLMKEQQQNISARGMGGSGAFEKGVFKKGAKATSNALASLGGQLAGQQAGTLAAMFEAAENRKFQERMAKMERQWQVDDFFRDTIGNVAEIGLSFVPLPGMAAGANANAARSGAMMGR